MKNKKTSDEVLTLQDQNRILDENWKRALADYQNLTKRIEADKKDFVKFATANILAKFIPILDILEMAALHSQDVGVKMAAKQFAESFKSENIDTIEPKVGDSYDQLYSECIETISTPDSAKDNTICELSLKGYRMGDYVLRPARVKVYKLALDKTDC